VSVRVREWLAAGEPAGVPFRLQRDFGLEALERHAGHNRQYIETVMLAAAGLYASPRDFRFLPVDAEMKILLPNSITLQSKKGEILVDSERKGTSIVLWAGAVVEVIE
jgi:hypothetical protein